MLYHTRSCFPFPNTISRPVVLIRVVETTLINKQTYFLLNNLYNIILIYAYMFTLLYE